MKPLLLLVVLAVIIFMLAPHFALLLKAALYFWLISMALALVYILLSQLFK